MTPSWLWILCSTTCVILSLLGQREVPQPRRGSQRKTHGTDEVPHDGSASASYTLGPIKWFLDKESLKKGYEEITADLDESEKRIVE